MSQKKIQFGIGIPQIFTGPIDSGLVARVLGKAEELDFHSAWVAERVFGKHVSLDPIVLLTYAAAVTSRIRIGSSILISVLRNPVFLAKGLATLDHLSGGRLTVGVGLGGFTQFPYYPICGVSQQDAAAQFEEGVQLMERLWGEDPVTFEGRFWQLKDVYLSPKPLQQPRPPLWFGAHAPSALRRSVRLGDGWMGSSVPAETPFAEEVALIRRYLEEEGKDPAHFPIAKRVYMAIDPDRKRASQRLREFSGRMYKDPEIAFRGSVYGSEEECAEGLAELAALDLDMIVVDLLYDQEEQIEQLAKDVLPKL